LRQFVGTETLINGISGVKVRVGVAESFAVGVSVSVGVNVGGSGVNVNVEVTSNVADKVACGAFFVKSATTVCAKNVLIAAVSGVEKIGIPVHAKLANNNAAAEKQVR